MSSREERNLIKYYLHRIRWFIRIFTIAIIIIILYLITQLPKQLLTEVSVLTISTIILTTLVILYIKENY